MSGLTVIQALLAPLAAVDAMASIVSLFALPDTRLRYATASIRMVTVLALPLYGLVNLVDGILENAGPSKLGVSATIFVGGAVVASLVYSRHDDNWFTGAGKRIQDKISSLFPGRAPDPA